MSGWIQDQIIFYLLLHKQKVYLPSHPLGSGDIHVLAAVVYYDSGSVSLVLHFCFAVVDRHFGFGVVGVAVIADFATVVASVGSVSLTDFFNVIAWMVAAEACCLDSD